MTPAVSVALELAVMVLAAGLLFAYWQLGRRQDLALANARVTDAGVKELAGVKTLQSLNLWNTQVTDMGLKELADLKSLRFLSLKYTQVTDAGVAELRKALPNCNISR